MGRDSQAPAARMDHQVEESLARVVDARSLQAEHGAVTQDFFFFCRRLKLSSAQGRVYIVSLDCFNNNDNKMELFLFSAKAEPKALNS